MFKRFSNATKVNRKHHQHQNYSILEKFLTGSMLDEQKLKSIQQFVGSCSLKLLQKQEGKLIEVWSSRKMFEPLLLKDLE